MTYAVVQRSLEVPDIEGLKRAFRVGTGLVALDAQIAARDAFGVLIKGRTLEDASALMAALEREGIPTEIIADKDLPILPDPTVVNRLTYDASGLMVYDALDRGDKIAWGQIRLIAAGKVRMTEFNQVRREREVPSKNSGRTHEKEVSYDTREQRIPRRLLELIVAGGAARFTIRAEEAVRLYECLGSRLTTDPTANFASLVQDMIQFAPGAVFNRGAFQIRNGHEPLAYPSRSAFHEEIIWLILRMLRAGKW